MMRMPLKLTRLGETFVRSIFWETPQKKFLSGKLYIDLLLNWLPMKQIGQGLYASTCCFFAPPIGDYVADVSEQPSSI